MDDSCKIARPSGRYLELKLGSVALACAVIAALAMPAFARHAHAHARAAGGGEESGSSAAPPPIVPLDQIHTFGNRPAPFALNAHAAELVALPSGTVLYAYHEHQRMQPASLAKMMTFYLTLDALREKRIALDTQMPVSEAAWRLSLNDSVSRMFLQVGQKVSVHNLLYGLMVSSGNDAAVVLAEYQAGSTDAFADLMNKKAQELGLNETHFTNPDGLPTDNEYTTAADMVKLGTAIIETFPDARQYTGAKDFTFNTTGSNGRTVTITQRNFNTLLFYDSRVNGIKTGHVTEAGYHLVASASSSGVDLVSAVMGTPSMEKRRVETDKLLDWAFRSFATVSPDWHHAIPARLRVYQGAIDEVPIAPAGGRASFVVNKGQEGKVVLVAFVAQKPLVAPMPQGTTVGQLTVTLAGQPISSVPIVTQEPVARGGIVHNMVDALRMKL